MKTKKNVPWAGWSKIKPNTQKQRKHILKKCGKKCFLGPKLSFPICPKNSCKINKKGVYSAYIRAKQWGKPKRFYKTGVRGRFPAKPRHPIKVYKRVIHKTRHLLR
jgi:hypothetical protein